MSESVAMPADLTLGTDTRTQKQRYLARLKFLEREAKDFFIDYPELADHFMPGHVRIQRGDKQRYSQPSSDVVNNIGVLAQRTTSSGMAAGLTSPARIWFALALPDLDLMRWGPTKSWLHAVAEAMFRLFARSNLYQVLPLIYAYLATFGTAAMVAEEDPVDGIRFYPWVTGSYFLANSARLTVDTGYRRLSMTAFQLVEEFGEEQVSVRVKNLVKSGNGDQLVDIIRVIEPNRTRDPSKVDYAGMPTSSCWFEVSSGENDKMLRKKGYRKNPLLAPRWDAVAEDAYGTGCGKQALPDSRMLQQYERRNGQAVDYLVEPALASSAQLQGSYPLPGEVVKTPFAGPQSQMGVIHTVQPAAITVLDARVQRLETRINELWFAHLWLMLSMEDQRQPITAREVVERHEEKLMQLGPVLVRLFNELLDPLIERTFDIMVRISMPFWARGERGPYFPPPPDELHGQQLRVEYISPLAQAQKLVGIAADERLAGFVGNIAAVKPDIVDKIDWDKMVEGYAERTSANPDIIIPQDKVDQARADRAQAQQQHQQITEQLPAAADAAKVLSETDVRGDSALNRLLYTQAGGAGVPAELPGAGRGG
jgi:hypothetical protein